MAEVGIAPAGLVGGNTHGGTGASHPAVPVPPGSPFRILVVTIVIIVEGLYTGEVGFFDVEAVARQRRG